MKIARLFFKVTGLMPNKEIVRTCKNIGLSLSKNISETGDVIDIRRVRELLVENIGAKKSSRITIADDFETFKRYVRGLGIDDKTAERFFKQSLSAVVPNPSGKDILFSLRTSSMEAGKALNTFTHELEHVLFKTISPKAFLDRLISKIRGDKWLRAYVEKYGRLMNEKMKKLQMDLIYMMQMGGNAIGGYTNNPLTRKGMAAQMGAEMGELSLNSRLRCIVRDVQIPDDPKLSLKIMRGMKGCLKDESRAYKAGGAVERAWNESQGVFNENANKSEMCAAFYDATLDIINKEIKRLKKLA